VFSSTTTIVWASSSGEVSAGASTFETKRTRAKMSSRAARRANWKQTPQPASK